MCKKDVEAWEAYKAELEKKSVQRSMVCETLDAGEYETVVNGFCESNEKDYDLDLPLYIINTIRMCEDRHLEFDESRCVRTIKGRNGNSRKVYDYDATREYQDEIRKTWVWKPITDKQLNWLFDMQQTMSKMELPRLECLCESVGVPASTALEVREMELLELSVQQASKLMGKLFPLRNAIQRPATQKQLDYIRQMQDCMTITDREGGELTEDQISNMDSSAASEYINKHRREFYAWQRSRPNDELLERIERILESSGQPYEFKIYANLEPETAEKLYMQMCKELEEDERKTTLEDADEFQRRTIDEQKEKFDGEEDEKTKLLYSLYSQIGEEVPDEDMNAPIAFGRIIEIGRYVKACGGSPAPAIKRTKLLNNNQKKFLLFSGVLNPEEVIEF